MRIGGTRTTFLFFLLAGTWIGISSSCSAQNQLALFKKNQIIYRFEEGEFIRFRRKDEDGFRRGTITGIHQDFFRINDDTTYTYDIARIDLRGKNYHGFKVSSIGKSLIVAGAGLFLIDAFNTTVIRDKSYEVDDGVLAASLAFVGTGALFQVVNNNYFKARGHRKIGTLIH